MYLYLPLKYGRILTHKINNVYFLVTIVFWTNLRVTHVDWRYHKCRFLPL